MSKQRAIGTAGETAVVKAAQDAGLTAHRCALAGSGDVGDVHIQHGQIVVEVKAGKAAESASAALCAAWWAETEAEANRVPQCNLAVLVVKRRGVGQARGWRAFVKLPELLDTITGYRDGGAGCPPLVVELPLGMLLDAFADAAGVAT